MKPHGLPHTCVMSKGEPYPVVVNKKSMVPCKRTRELFKHEVPSLHEREYFSWAIRSCATYITEQKKGQAFFALS